MTTYKTIWISDCHLGTKAAQARLLHNFLINNQCENLYLVGDIVDMWALKRRMYWPSSHSKVLERILYMSQRGTKVRYIVGNHDEDLRPWLHFNIDISGVEVLDHDEYIDSMGRRILVVHGDFMDKALRGKTGSFITSLGNYGYMALVEVNTLLNKARSILGMDYWSLADFCKVHVKMALQFILKFEEGIVEYGKSSGYDGVVCGHIHNPRISEHGEFLYMNDGDWVDSCTALVETMNGEYKIVKWNKFIK